MQNLKDERFKNWMDVDTIVSKALRLFIELEDILVDLDDLSRANDQCYMDFEDFQLQVGATRSDFTKFVESNLEVLEITEDNYDSYFKQKD